MDRYAVKLTGDTPIIMNWDKVEWADFIVEWRSHPENKKTTIAGDDRTPPWMWIGKLYNENGIIVMPSDNLMSTFRNGALKIPTGKGKGTFKAQSQSGILVDDPSWPLLVNGNEIPYEPFRELILKEVPYEEHVKLAQSFGFELFAKRVPVNKSKHVRVRPRFDNWSCEGTITVIDDMITERVFTDMLTYAGIYSGLCDWRPSSPRSPGQFGKFSVEIVRLK